MSSIPWYRRAITSLARRVERHRLCGEDVAFGIHQLDQNLVLAALARGETVDPSKYYFRTTPRFETSAPPYTYLNRVIAIASADRRPGGPVYTIEEVL